MILRSSPVVTKQFLAAKSLKLNWLTLDYIYSVYLSLDLPVNHFVHFQKFAALGHINADFDRFFNSETLGNLIFLVFFF